VGSPGIVEESYKIENDMLSFQKKLPHLMMPSLARRLMADEGAWPT
jgi:hypothetical protein